MTETELSEYESYVSTRSGRLSIAAAELTLKTLELLHRAKKAANLTNRALAREMDVTDGRISQILNGDGNLHMATVGRAFAACGYKIELVATPIAGQGKAPLGSATPSRRKKRPANRTAVTYDPRSSMTLQMRPARTQVPDSAGLQPARRWGSPRTVDIASGIGDEIVVVTSGIPKPHKHIVVANKKRSAVDDWVAQTRVAAYSEDPAAVKR